MNSKSMRDGALIGAAGGMAMAMWAMAALAVEGTGFWAPVNAIAHSVWAEAPLSGDFDAASLAIGLSLHMAVSMMLGITIAVVASTTTSVAARTGIAVGLAMAAWAGQLVVWSTLDETGSDLITSWVLFVGHVMFGMVAAVGLILAQQHDEADAPLTRQPVAATR